MNKFYQKTLFLLLLILVSACKSSDQKVSISKIYNQQSVILKINNNLKKITGIKLPLNIKMSNNNNFDKDFLSIDYYYDDQNGAGIELFYNDKRISNNSRKTVSPSNEIEFSIYTRHLTDSTKLIQQQFKPYIEKMLKENKDTLHVGTVSDFKKNHKEFFEKLTKNDSISIQFLDGKKLGERITVPVEW